jgi:L-seryl-tRNA(Ser) seleniumtransferase
MHPPSVDALARSLAADEVCGHLPHALLVDAAREAIGGARAAGDPGSSTARALTIARSRAQRMLRPVVNATGTLLHTNLGRAPAPAHAAAPGPEGIAWRSSNLEFDLDDGIRGSRREHAAALLARLCGAEGGLVVNNCAAAVMLVLAALGRPLERGEVVVSRGELVEIGGGFRIPEVLEQSGCVLREVGTTNRTRRRDYERVIGPDTSLLLKVHPSNYRITGFTEAASVEDLADLGVPLVADIGSGLLDESLSFLADRSGKVPSLPWLAGEPGARQTLERGAAIAVFSGDKLLGGPQAGIVVGRRELVEACAAHPLARALRPGGLVLTALQRVALDHLAGRAADLPFWRMALAAPDVLRHRAQVICAQMATPLLHPIECASVPGGGTLPGVEIPSAGIAGPERMLDALRMRTQLPVIARLEDGRCVIDLRTVDPADDAEVIRALKECIS